MILHTGEAMMTVLKTKYRISSIRRLVTLSLLTLVQLLLEGGVYFVGKLADSIDD